MRVTVSYSVPVMVTVDIDEGTVERVRVIGESVEQDLDGYAEDADTFADVPEDAKLAAFNVAESVEWPSWD